MTHELVDPSAHPWQDAVVYQIYPRSFADSTGSGEGDLQGIRERLGYLNGSDLSLGANAIWLNPFYPSPMKDGGYDVSNYTAIDERYGTMPDFQRFITAAHERDIRVMVDFVANHTSSEHPWFQASRQSKTGPLNDFYIWADAKPDGSPPNDMLSVFARREYNQQTQSWDITPRSAWNWDAQRGQYYFASFAAEQPDLNWHNPEVQEAMCNSLRFWLDLGVDGFRVDAANHFGKDEQLITDPQNISENRNPRFDPQTDNPYDRDLHEKAANDPSMFRWIKLLSDVLTEEKYTSRPRFMVTEAYLDHATPKQLAAYYDQFHAINPRVLAPLNFAAIDLPPHKWQEFLDLYLTRKDPATITTHVADNHDKVRAPTRLGSVQKALGLAAMQLTLPGMPFIYYGSELALPNVHVPPEKVDDILHGRDGSRTPMLWNRRRNAGFTTGEPWLPVHAGSASLCVEAQLEDPQSPLAIFRQILYLRREVPALHEGRYVPIDTGHVEVLGFGRETDDEDRHMILFNNTPRSVMARPFEYERISELYSFSGRIILSTAPEHREGETLVTMNKIMLEPYEAVVIEEHAIALHELARHRKKYEAALAIER